MENVYIFFLIFIVVFKLISILLFCYYMYTSFITGGNILMSLLRCAIIS